MINFLLIFIASISFAQSNPTDKSAIIKEIRQNALDFYKESAELMAEIGAIAASQRYLKKMNINEKFESKVENLAVQESANRETSIKLFEEYVAKYPMSRFIPDVLYRLGQLYFEDSAEKVIRETEAYESAFQKFSRGEIQILPPEPDIDYSRAINYLKMLIRDYKGYRFRDRALYLLGYSYFEEGRIEQSVVVFDSMVNEFPKSDKLPEVYTRLGEYYFDIENFDKAIFYYSHVLEYPDSAYYDKVLYKLAWSYYRKKRVIDAADFFVALIDFHNKKFGENSQGSLKKEAKNYLAINFSEYGNGISQAYSFFRRIGGRSYEYEIIDKICELYQLSDRVKEITETVDFALQYYNNHPKNPFLFERLIKTYEQLGKIRETNKQRGRLAGLFGKGSGWYKSNIENTNAIVAAERLIEEHLLKSAYYYQKEADNSKSRRDYIRAAMIYYNFLDQYPNSNLALGARFSYAQVLFNLKDYNGAIIEFSKVMRYKEDTTYRDDSAYSIVSSWQLRLKNSNSRYLEGKLKPLLSDKGKLLPKGKLSELENSLVKAGVEYEEYNPKGRKLPLIWYTMAEVYFRNSNLEKARELYLKVISNYPSEKIAIDSTKNIIASYNYEGKYAMVEEWSKKLLASGSLGVSGKDLSEIKGLLTGSLFKSAQKLEDTNKLDEAASEYIKLAEQYPTSSYSDAALYNSGLIYEKLGKTDLAIVAYKNMLKKYPKTTHAANAEYRIAVNREQQLDFDGAVTKYEAITKKYPSSSVATDSYYNAARLRRANNQFSKAAENLIQYHNKVTSKAEKTMSLLQAAKLYEKDDNDTKALQIYGIYIADNSKDMDGVMEAYIARGHIYEKNKKKEAALNEYKKAYSYYKNSGSPEGTIAGHYAAEARYRIVENIVAVYDSIKIRSTSAKSMKTIYEKKEKLLQQIAEAFLDVVKLGSPEWSVASLYRIGYVFQVFANFLYDAPIPKELNTEELKQEYSSQLQMQAIPFEDKAMEYYEKAIAESVRLKIVNDWTRLAKQKMVLLKPDQYSLQKDEISVVSPSMDIISGGFIGK